ncbi:MAG: AarF/UbiB family protein [Planctomycetota bacterium]
MALPDFARLPRNLKRLGEIVLVFGRHGFNAVLVRLNLREHVPFAKRFFPQRIAVTDRELSPEKRLVNALEELGPTFVKLGQILSARPDIAGESLANELKKLRDRVRPFDSQLAVNAIEAELEAPIADLFDSFDETPAGSGSIAQVHRARLKDGTDVMVKVRRPGIEHLIFSDLAILRFVARIAENQMPEIRPRQIVDEFERAVRDELDFTVEASHTAKFHLMLQETPGVCAPRVFWDRTTSAVLTVERLSGVPITETAELDRRGHDRSELARTLAECFMSQYFQTGVFHADPHGGNMVVADDGTIGIIDFGMVGHLSRELKGQLTTILLATLSEDIDFLADAASELGAAGPEFDRRQLSTDLTALYHKYSGMPLGRMDTRRIFSEITRTARQNDLSLPRDLVLLTKSMGSLSGVTRVLDPSFDVLEEAAPKARELLIQKIDPKRAVKSAGLQVLNLLHMLRTIPRDIRAIIRKTESGQLEIGHRHEGLPRAVTEFEKASNRLAISIYVAALLVASSLLIRTRFLEVRGISLPGVLGYVLAGALSVWLAWGILRSGRL